MTAVQRDKVEKVAVLAGGGIGPFAGGAAATRWAGEADEQAPARIAVHIAREPVVSAAPPPRQIFLADGFGILGEPGGQVRGVALHGSAAAARCAEGSGDGAPCRPVDIVRARGSDAWRLFR